MQKFARLMLIVLMAGACWAHNVDTIPLVTLMSPANENPAVTSITAGATALIRLHVTSEDGIQITGGVVDFIVNYNFGSAVTITGLHIHEAAAGVSGSIVVPTDLSASNPINFGGGSGSVFRQVVVTDAALMTRLVHNPSGFYVNMHTTDNPGGVMRGQLGPTDVLSLRTRLLPSNEVPANSVDCSGSAAITAYAVHNPSGQVVGGAVDFNVNYRFASAVDLTGLHIHNGPAGVNASIVFPTVGFSSSNPLKGVTQGNYNELVPVQTASQITNLVAMFSNPQGFYTNMHTTANPGGVMRGQLNRAGSIVLRADMSSASEAPPVTGSQGDAVSKINVLYSRSPSGQITGATVVFNINYESFPANTTFTGLHIHNAPLGVSGSVVIPTDLSGSNSVVSAAGVGNIFRGVNVDADNPTVLSFINKLVADPDQFYVNLHTTTFPSGVVRGQLGSALAGAPQVGAGGIISAVNDTTIAPASPGSIVSLYGTNLSQTTSDATGVDQPFLPITMNGTEVQVNGRQASLFFVSPLQINFQVPYETAAGNAQVFVVHSGNFSAPYQLPVAQYSPGIFVGSLGAAGSVAAVLKNVDFSLVSPSNPAAAGDVLSIFGTGLGAVTPQVQDGQFAPLANVPLTTGTPKVTIGGVNADVLASSLAPGFAGLYQVAIRMPGGVPSGNQPLVMIIGNLKSNSAPMAVK